MKEAGRGNAIKEVKRVIRSRLKPRGPRANEFFIDLRLKLRCKSAIVVSNIERTLTLWRHLRKLPHEETQWGISEQEIIGCIHSVVYTANYKQ